MITTLNKAGVPYTPIVSDKVEGSLFRDVSLGVNLKREISVKHTEYVDNKTKRLGRLSQIRLDRYIEMADGQIAPVTFTMTAKIPRDVNVTADIIGDVISVAANAHADHEGYTNIGTPVFVNGEQ